MTAPIEIVVFGTPRPQGSMSLFRAKSGHEVAKYSNATYEWRHLVTQAAIAELDKSFAGPIEAPVVVTMAFEFARPKSHFGTGRNAGQLKPSAPAHMTTSPDADKLARAVNDSLTDALVWADDAQVVAMHVSKRYVEGNDHPGVTIRVELA